jgi:hypothetical protein
MHSVFPYLCTRFFCFFSDSIDVDKDLEVSRAKYFIRDQFLVSLFGGFSNIDSPDSLIIESPS